MYGILLSAFNSVLAFVLRAVVMKSLVFGLLLFIATEATSWFLDKISSMGDPTSGLQSAISGMGSGALFFIGVLRLDVGLPMIFAAYVAGFAIRRLPIIG